MSKYPMIPLSEIFDLQMGKTPSRSNSDYWENGEYKWISISDLSISDKFVYRTKERISKRAVAESGIKVVPSHTVVMSFKLSIGKTAITSEPMYTNEAIMAFHDRGKYPVDIDFIYHLFSHWHWNEGTNKAVMGATLNKATLQNISIPLPPIGKQKEIAASLDAVSEVLRLRKAQLAELDKLVKSQFIEMFGDPMTNDKGWKRTTLRNVARRISDGPFGSNLKSEHYSQEGIRVIRLQNIGVSRFLDDDKAYIPEDHYEKIKKYTCRSGEVVIGTLGDPNLRACIIPEHVDIAINKADCVHFIPKSEEVNACFVCEYINQPATLTLAGESIHGQTRSRISMSQVAALPIFVPPLQLQTHFADFVRQADKSKYAIQQALDETQRLFDSLMAEYFEE